MGLIGITSVTERRARVQPEWYAGLQIDHLSLPFFVLIWKLCKKMCKNDEATSYSLLIKFARSGTMNNAVIAAEIVDCPIR